MASPISDPRARHGTGTGLARTTRSPAETETLAARLGARLVPGDCLGLDGPLGAGKTVFVRGLVRGAGAGGAVRSPTFVLHAVHPGPVTVHHLDLYRLQGQVDLRTLGVEELLDNGAVVVEWAERAADDWYGARCRLTPLAGDGRRLVLTAPARLAGAWSGA